MGSFGWKDIVEAVERNDTSFDTRIADNTTNRLDLPATYPFNTERHKLVVNDSEVRDAAAEAAFTDLPGKWQLTASDGDTVEFASRERLRYVPNYETLFGAVAWYETAPADDQRLFVELSDDARENVYRYQLTPGDSQVAQLSGGADVDSVPESEFGAFGDATDRDHNPFDIPGVDRTTPLNPRGFINWYGGGNFRASVSYTRDNGAQFNPVLGQVANQDDIATEEINLRVRVVAEADAGASEFTVNIGSLGALIRGNATEIDRPKPFTVESLGGSIGTTFAENDPVLAVRGDPDLPQVVSEILPYPFEPGGSDVMELAAVVVDEADTDASGFVTPIIQAGPDADSQNSAIQATTQVTSFPTATKTDVKGNSVTAPNPDRLLATTVASGAKKGGGETTTEATVAEKRVFDDNEVVLFLPRQISGSDGGIDWLTVPTRSDW